MSSEGDADLIEAVSAHLERHLGPIELVLHEQDSDAIHLDVFVVAPSDAIPFRVLVTCGMSEHRMTPPDDAPAATRCELVIGLPADWPFSSEAWQDERHYWPIRMLKGLGRLPLRTGAWLWKGHTVDNEEPYAEGEPFTGALIGPAMMPDGFEQLHRSADEHVAFFGVFPLHPAELELGAREGGSALYDGFEEAGVDVVVDPGRPSTV